MGTLERLSCPLSSIRPVSQTEKPLFKISGRSRLGEQGLCADLGVWPSRFQISLQKTFLMGTGSQKILSCETKVGLVRVPLFGDLKDTKQGAGCCSIKC